MPPRTNFFAALFVIFSGLLSMNAIGASLSVQVTDPAGAPLNEAVIYAMPLHGTVPPAKPTEIVIDQIKRHFVPMISVARTGTSVRFPNKDNFEHDVYSFSTAKLFHLNLYHGQAAQPVLFDKPGLVVMGCSIHDQMIAYLLVVDTPYFAKTDASGVAHIANLPADTYKVRVWYYKMTDPNHLVEADIAATADAKPVKVAVALKAD